MKELKGLNNFIEKFSINDKSQKLEYLKESGLKSTSTTNINRRKKINTDTKKRVTKKNQKQNNKKTRKLR